ncbi:MAG: NADP-dependent oxidoreductase [Bdellovibrio sp.]|nr:NADP-dependent oxidoreductase [Methylotenera sp.]
MTKVASVSSKPALIPLQKKISNRHIVLNSRPTGVPTTANFRLEKGAVPSPADGEVLLRTLYLSLDPYMRGRMSDAESYAPAVGLNEVMVGATVSIVETSRNADYQKGEIVLSANGWQEYALSKGQGLFKLTKDVPTLSLNLGVLGMPGFTAYMGLLDIGQPKANETVVVAAASGAVGAVVGQIAKLQGCYVVGVAGGADKCRYVVDELGFDVCLDHNADNFAQQLANACSKGIDVYFESVGGKVFDAVLPLLNTKARIPVCGLISSYNHTSLPQGPDRLGLLEGILLRKRIKMQGFIIFDDYSQGYPEFVNQMSAWLKQGKIKFLEDMTDGLENAPQAFIGMLKGKNFGKTVVQVSAL